MDVVAREIGQLKGSIELQTEPGRGTRLTIRLPARLAFEPTMIVRIDGQAFAMPVAQIVHAQPLEPGRSPAGREATGAFPRVRAADPAGARPRNRSGCRRARAGVA